MVLRCLKISSSFDPLRTSLATSFFLGFDGRCTGRMLGGILGNAIVAVAYYLHFHPQLFLTPRTLDFTIYSDSVSDI